MGDHLPEYGKGTKQRAHQELRGGQRAPQTFIPTLVPWLLVGDMTLIRPCVSAYTF